MTDTSTLRQVVTETGGSHVLDAEAPYALLVALAAQGLLRQGAECGAPDATSSEADGPYLMWHLDTGNPHYWSCLLFALHRADPHQYPLPTTGYQEAVCDDCVGAQVLQYLAASTTNSGPFHDFIVDQVMMPRLLAWAGEDWQRLRLVLNYVFERGEHYGISLVQRAANDLHGSSIHREQHVWLPDLQRAMQ